MSRFDTPEGKTPTIILTLAAAAALVAFVTFIFPVAVDRETSRREAVRTYNCEYYGSEMNQWARSKGYSLPCENI
jgi:hypothetical protein